MRKLSLLTIVLVFFVAAAAWSGGQRDETPAAVTDGVTEILPPYQWADSTITESEDLQAWGGKRLNLVWWMGHGLDNLPPEKSYRDVVSPEIERVTGVSIDYENSYANDGNTFDVRLAMLAGTRDWPHIVTSPQLLRPLVEGDVIYDLTDLVPKYMPNLMKRYPMEVFKPAWDSERVNAGYQGKIYAVPIEASSDVLQAYSDVLAPDLDKQRFAAFAPPQDVRRSSMKIRDDVLKMLFPEAKSQDEIEVLFMEQGFFTREQVYDVPIRSKEEFFDLLYKIHALGLKEGDLPVYPTYAFSGLDNYPLSTRLFSQLLGWGWGGADCFSYWDNIEKQVRFTFRDPEFIEMQRTFNRLVREGILPRESLIDDGTAFTQKINNGLYAFAYAEWRWPNDALLAEQGKPYRYRKIYFDIPVRTDKFVQPEVMPSFGSNLAIFKSKVAPEDVPQILRWIDYHFSDAYLNLVHWGPRSAGLYTEVGGRRKIVDPELEEALLYNNNPDLLATYWLHHGAWNPGYLVRRLAIRPFGQSGSVVSQYAPFMVYDAPERNKDEANRYFSSGLVETIRRTPTLMPWIWTFADNVRGVERMWAARKTWEDALLRTLTATSDAEFDRLYQEFLLTTERIGLTEQTLVEMNADFARRNADFMDNLMNY